MSVHGREPTSPVIGARSIVPPRTGGAPSGATAPADARIAGVATHQMGVISTHQLVTCGVSPSGISRRVRAGSLIRIERGVYAVGHAALTADSRRLAALLTIGEDAFLGHATAGAVWDIDRGGDSPIEVVVPGRRVASRPGLRVRQTVRLDPADRARRGPLRVTGLARTILDLAQGATSGDVERMVAEAGVKHRLRADALVAAASRTARSAGVAAVLAVLHQDGGPRWTRSVAERRFLALVRRSGLPLPATNVAIGRYEVDAIWQRERLVVEIDGFAFHGGRRAFETDRRRDADLAASGLAVVRFTWREISDAPEAVVARLAAILTVRGPEVGRRSAFDGAVVRRAS